MKVGVGSWAAGNVVAQFMDHVHTNPEPNTDFAIKVKPMLQAGVFGGFLMVVGSPWYGSLHGGATVFQKFIDVRTKLLIPLQVASTFLVLIPGITVAHTVWFALVNGHDCTTAYTKYVASFVRLPLEFGIFGFAPPHWKIPIACTGGLVLSTVNSWIAFHQKEICQIETISEHYKCVYSNEELIRMCTEKNGFEKTAFKLMDRDCNGVITKDEMKEYCGIAGIPFSDEVFDMMDKNKDDVISYDEFIMHAHGQKFYCASFTNHAKTNAPKSPSKP